MPSCPHFGILAVFAVLTLPAVVQTAAAQQTAEGAGDSGVRRALIVVGLPGDAEHRALFADVTSQWIAWLTGPLQLDQEQVVVLQGRGPGEEPRRGPATRQSLSDWARRLSGQSRPRDSLWVLFLGHANYDGEHAYFHLPGPDVDEEDVAEMFAGLQCREQVFWLTHACSGWFLKPLSRKGRIVITATAADLEVNETEFPLALAQVAGMPARSLDADEDGRTSVAELLAKVVEQVEAIYEADNRVPTEHAQLDDNGDGAGTEAPQLELKPPSAEASTDASGEPAPAPAARRVKLPDGQRAAATLLPAPPAP